jgi:hypothetical protein
VFQSLAVFIVGNGESTLFWTDRWINGRSAGDIAPEVMSLVPTRRRNSRKVSEALQEDAWISDVEGDLSIDGWMQCSLLWEAIEGVPRAGDRPDQFAWRGAASGKYTTRETYGMLCQGRISWAMAKPVWRSLAPLKCKFFGWLALRYRLWTSDRRVQHGRQDRPDPALLVFRRRTTLTIFLCSARMLKWSGLVV